MTQLSSSVSSISSLSDELLTEIIVKLGYAKYAVRCKCVSKFWLSVINDSYFMRRWNQVNRKEEKDLPTILVSQFSQYQNYMRVIDYGSLNYSHPERLPFSISLAFLPEEEGVCVLAAHKDLMLCCPSHNRFFDNHEVYYLCNIFTKQWTTLPKLPPCEGQEDIIGFRVYDDDGFTFKFEVLRGICYHDASEWEVEIFSSEYSSNGWRQVDLIEGWNNVFACPDRNITSVTYDGMLTCLATSSKYASELVGFKFNPTGVDRTHFHLPSHCGENTMIGMCEERLRLAQLVCISPNGFEFEFGYFYPDALRSANPILKIWDFNRECWDWELAQEFDMKEMRDSTDCSLVKSCLQNLGHRWSIFMKILAFHPFDGNILYLFFWFPSYRQNPPNSIIMCNVEKRTLEVIGELSHTTYIRKLFPLLMPSWPTSIPPPS